MAQPIKKCRKKKAEIKLIGLEYCNECPFLGYNENGYICNPNDYIFGNVRGKIPVPKWCGNSKKSI
jgi:hypothetical protein